MQLQNFRNEPFTDFSTPANQEAFQQALTKVREQILGKTWSCWIGGEKVTGSKTFDTHDPGETTRTVGTFQELTVDDADRAVTAAHAAFPAWAETPVQQRIDIVMKAAQKMRAQLDPSEAKKSNDAALPKVREDPEVGGSSNWHDFGGISIF